MFKNLNKLAFNEGLRGGKKALPEERAGGLSETGDYFSVGFYILLHEMFVRYFRMFAKCPHRFWKFILSSKG